MSRPLKTLDIDFLSEICKDMTRREIEDFLLAQVKSGQTKNVSRIGQILLDLMKREKYTIEELKDDSPIEEKMAMELRFYKIPFKRKVKVGKCELDFVIENKGLKIDVECDGYDWHTKDFKQVERDRKRDRFMLSKGYIVLRFSGSQIEKDIFRCVQNICQVAGLTKRTGK